MTDNERIAVWVGWKKLDEPEMHCLCWAPGHYALDPSEFWWQNPNGKNVAMNAPSFDSDITLWHGKDGILAEVERRGLQVYFQEYIRCEVYANYNGLAPISPAEAWSIRRAEPCELSSALVEMIREDG